MCPMINDLYNQQCSNELKQVLFFFCECLPVLFICSIWFQRKGMKKGTLLRLQPILFVFAVFSVLPRVRSGGGEGAPSIWETKYANITNPMMVAAKWGLIDDLKELMNTQPSEQGNDGATEEDDRGMTPFLYAAQEGHNDIVEYLVTESNGAVLYDRDKDGASAMFYAAARDHIATVKLLHRHGGNISLHIASMIGDVSEVKRALSPAADDSAENDVDDVNEDYYGWTPLHLASNKGHAEVVRLLVLANANVSKKDANGWTALHKASYGNHLEVVKILYSKGHANLNSTSNNGETPLSTAASRNSTGVVKYLLEQGADPHQKDNFGTHPLTFALEHNYTVCVELLRQYVDPDVFSAEYVLVNVPKVLRKYAATEETKELIHTLIREGDLEAIGILSQVSKQIERGPIEGVFLDVNEKDLENKYTPLMYAVVEGDKAIVEQLLSFPRINSNAKARDGSTALHLATGNNDVGMVKLLAGKGNANINAKDYNGFTSLHIAAEKGNLNMVETLIDLSADVDETDRAGNKPSFWCRNYEKVYEKLTALEKQTKNPKKKQQEK